MSPDAGPSRPAAILPLSEHYQPKKKKQRTKATVVYSQPMNTGLGKQINTQITMLVDTLKQRNGPMSIDDLSIITKSNLSTDPDLRALFEAHERVSKNPINGLYSYEFEQEAVASREDLLKEIKSSSRKGGGLSIKGLKDRWASAVTEIEALEMEGLVLVTRPMKEGVPGPPKMVFWNDLPPKDGNPIQKIEPEFLIMWNDLKWPSTVPEELEKALHLLGQTPAQTTATPVKSQNRDRKKRKGQARVRTSKILNTHLDIDLTKDYVVPGAAAASSNSK